uniref:Phage major capsid protein, HK97 family n=1 Tax=uncultured marine virus TaxID=186617 RepID=A0A0F7L4G5_9VIRU|nr:phage major capsid protein, HK97 family [uncultured marine virus]
MWCRPPNPAAHAPTEAYETWGAAFRLARRQWSASSSRPPSRCQPSSHAAKCYSEPLRHCLQTARVAAIRPDTFQALCLRPFRSRGSAAPSSERGPGG